MDQASAKPRRTARARPPVSAHPAFAAIVALWFAALLGLTSLAVAPALLEQAVAATRLDTIVAAAAPPLGQTARLLLALGLAGLGGLGGLMLGRALAARVRPAPALATDQAFSVGVPARASRGLFELVAVLTGKGEGPRDFDDLPLLRARDRHPDAPPRKPLSAQADLGGIAGEPAGEAEGQFLAPFVRDRAAEAGRSAPAMDGESRAPAPGVAESGVSALDPVDDARAPEEPNSTGPTLVFEPTGHDLRIAESALVDLGVVQLCERLAIAMRARRERDAGRAGEGAPLALVLPPLPAANGANLLARRECEAGLGGREGAPDRAAARVENPPALDDDDAATDAGYSSLLDLARPGLRPEPVRNDEPVSDGLEPAVVFPSRVARSLAAATPPAPGPCAASGHAQDPVETGRALRAALVSLQRIAGTR